MNFGLFGVFWVMCAFIVALGYFLFAVFAADAVRWDYAYSYPVGSEAVCISMIGDDTMSTFPLVVVAFLIALPFALKLARLARW